MKRYIFAAICTAICLVSTSFAGPTGIDIFSTSLNISGYGFATYQNETNADSYDFIDDQSLTAEISGTVLGYGYDASSNAWAGSAGDIPISSPPWGPDVCWAPDWADSLSIGVYTENWTDDTGGDSEAHANAQAAYTFTPRTDSLDMAVSLRTTGGSSQVWLNDLTDNTQLLSYQYDAPIDPFSMYTYSDTFTYALDPSHLYSLEMTTQTQAIWDTFSQTQLHTALMSESAIIPAPGSLLLTTIGLILLAHIKQKKFV